MNICLSFSLKNVFVIKHKVQKANSKMSSGLPKFVFMKSFKSYPLAILWWKNNQCNDKSKMLFYFHYFFCARAMYSRMVIIEKMNNLHLFYRFWHYLGLWGHIFNNKAWLKFLILIDENSKRFSWISWLWKLSLLIGKFFDLVSNSDKRNM